MDSSAVPDVPWTSSVESPDTAAARCSDTQDLAVPGSPSSSSARSVARVATATSISRRDPMYFGLTIVPSGRLPPTMYVTTAQGESRQRGGRGRPDCLSYASSAASSAANASSACGLSTTGAAGPAAPGSKVCSLIGAPASRTSRHGGERHGPALGRLTGGVERLGQGPAHPQDLLRRREPGV